LIVGPLVLLALFLAYGVRPVTAIIVAVVVTLVIHYAFYKLLRVPLPWGVLTRFAF
jgi:putative tricarboxylic transport membrane protein